MPEESPPASADDGRRLVIALAGRLRRVRPRGPWYGLVCRLLGRLGVVVDHLARDRLGGGRRPPLCRGRLLRGRGPRRRLCRARDLLGTRLGGHGTGQRIALRRRALAGRFGSGGRAVLGGAGRRERLFALLDPFPVLRTPLIRALALGVRHLPGLAPGPRAEPGLAVLPTGRLGLPTVAGRLRCGL